MKKGSGKSKGGAFERLICSKLSLWVSQNQRDDLFWRSSQSGGRASVRFKKGKDTVTAGDITAIHPDGMALTDRYIIECKFVKNMHFDSIIFDGPNINIDKIKSKKPPKDKKKKPKSRVNNNDKIAAWWKILQRECKNHNKRPVLIVKQNRRPILMGVPLTLNRSAPDISLIRLFKQDPKPLAIFPNIEMEFYNFNDYINTIQFENFCR